MYRVGSCVLSLAEIHDDVIGEICTPGDRGRVIDVEEDKFPGECLLTVRFERTGRASLVDQSEIVATRGTPRGQC